MTEFDASIALTGPVTSQLPASLPSSHRPTKVFFGNLSYFVTYAHLSKLVENLGDIHAMNLCKSKDNTPLYYAFINFKRLEEAEKAVATLDQKMFMGRKLRYIII